MNRSKLLLAASFFSAALMTSALQSGSANAAPSPQTQIAKIVKTDTVEEARYRGGRGGRFVGKRFVKPGKFFKPGKWCKNHPYKCFGGGYRPWRWCKNHPRRCFGARYLGGYGYGVGYAGPRCHRHLFKVPGMHFHPGVRCGHRHFRAYRSWVWVR